MRSNQIALFRLQLSQHEVAVQDVFVVYPLPPSHALGAKLGVHVVVHHHVS